MSLQLQIIIWEGIKIIVLKKFEYLQLYSIVEIMHILLTIADTFWGFYTTLFIINCISSPRIQQI